jgi:hypothetical protein
LKVTCAVCHGPVTLVLMSVTSICAFLSMIFFTFPSYLFFHIL